ncbi:MAG: OmpA family protein [Dechloromonas sp.]|nr:OmpA family protein [Dechloromonas sp.]
MSRSCRALCLLAVLASGCASQLPVAESTAEDVPTAIVVAKPHHDKPQRRSEVPTERQVMAAVNDEESIFFSLGGTEIDAVGKLKLQAYAQRLKEDPSKVVTLIGHTDDLGSPSYNLAIAQGRVNAVHEILRARGVPQMQIRRYGVGSEKNNAVCQSESCRQKMRRVQMMLGG